MTRSLAPVLSLGLAALVVAAPPSVALAQTPTTQPSGDTPFSSMAIARDEADACRVPKPPIDLAETAYLRNGYRAILRIMAAEKWQESHSCECYLTQITWQEVVERSADFMLSDDARRPFDVSELRLLADEMLAEHDKACIK
ncbi:hypothetical protein PGB28_19360 [Primorskyibacter aestuariivivens]|uniref:hypothetical protein n=1 Tax=Primorskyibacter aestuariivivens TaxID=1888912 RepID=UPI00230073CA|nr:hypothetical protein [Primorskyibacter aestuariivivens]MDA7430626.1 hypothetical protein [Primorskyibacter aestuariivivens]